MTHNSALRQRIKDEPFFPNSDGPRHGNAGAFRDYQRRVLAILDEYEEEGRRLMRWNFEQCDTDGHNSTLYERERGYRLKRVNCIDCQRESKEKT
jgi:hypothetical protein